DPPHLAREDPEPGCRGIFLAPFEEKLHSDAQAEQRDAPFADRRDREVEAEPPQLAGAVAEVADTGKDDRPRGEGLGLGPRHAHVRRAGASQSALNAGEVADTVVEDRDHPIRPFEPGTPTRRGSRRDAPSIAPPRTRPRSSTVWCWSTSRSPFAFTVRSKRPCTATSSSMWSRNGSPVRTVALPDPSSAKPTCTLVSFVRRASRARRDCA